ncbi:MAG: OB-fold nucleic acid binding domain-containing protein [Candidatus Diapherotrites archaeon]|nr:OB-fold nucleic acid binding domain-containing protein [Candidatus Diapherotrites archaeon]
MGNHFDAACIIIAIAGIALLIASEAPAREVTSLDSTEAGESVILSGIITSKYSRNGHVFLEVNDTKAVIFNAGKEHFLMRGDPVRLKGIVNEYNGEKELIASEAEP